MSKKQQKKTVSKKAVIEPEKSVLAEAVTLGFGFDEMLGELEAIIVEAEVRLEQEARLA